MGRLTIGELRRMGVSADDIELAKTTQAAQRATGAKVQQIGVIVGLVDQRKAVSQPVNLTDRAMRKRGTYDQAALLLDQQALKESSPERAARARDAAQVAKELSAAQQHEFDFFGGGNVSIAFQYHDAVTERLRGSGETLAKQHQAMAVLWVICRHLAWQTHECTKSAAELSELTGIKPNHMSPVLQLLETIGAITRVKKGRAKIITVTPEGAFRGNVHTHAQAVERYRLDVIEGGKSTPQG